MAFCIHFCLSGFAIRVGHLYTPPPFPVRHIDTIIFEFLNDGTCPRSRSLTLTLETVVVKPFRVKFGFGHDEFGVDICVTVAYCKNRNGKPMSKVERIINKFGLRNPVVLKCKDGATGQKMDEECIQKFVKGDLSGNGKYLEWMFLQAGGGKERMERSLLQWEIGEPPERSFRERLKEAWIKDEISGWIEDTGEKHAAKTKEQAEKGWDQVEEEWRVQHIYGDEDFSDVGFSFVQSWPGRNSLYERIVAAARRFHKFQSKLKAMKVKMDLTLANYPQIKNLEDVVSDIWALEIRSDIDAEKIYEDDIIVAWVPFNIGASLKYGIPKWCSSNDSNFSAVVQGNSLCRWKEYSSVNMLVYCRFKAPHAKRVTRWDHVAIQIPFKIILTSDIGGDWAHATFWDNQDIGHSYSEFLMEVSFHASNKALIRKSIEGMMGKVESFADHYPYRRLVCDFLKKYQHLVPKDILKRSQAAPVAVALGAPIQPMPYVDPGPQPDPVAAF